VDGKTRSSTLVWRAAYLLLIGLGAFALYTSFVGFTDGEIALFSKRVEGTIRFDQSPFWFSVTSIFWLFGGIYLIYLGISGWREP
jgi:uncharacterized membrane protein